MQDFHPSQVRFELLSPSNWAQFEDLMGEKGGCGGCWCMSFRVPTHEFEAGKGRSNREEMKSIVEQGRPVGLMAFQNQEPRGWIAFAPREDYIKIERSRSLKRIDEKPVWSITCLFIKREYRRKKFSAILIRGVIEYARQNRIETLEAYPVIPYSDAVSAPFLWTGILSVFLDCGFLMLRQYGKTKAMVRLDL
jgi:GNAT superfamily N-acetyltransferase